MMFNLQQWRLFPHLAATYALDNFSLTLHQHFANFQSQMVGGGDKDTLVRKTICGNKT